MNIDAIVAEAMKDNNFAEMVKAKLEEAEKVKTWPRVGNDYFFVDTIFRVCYRSGFDPKDPEHATHKETGNCFRTLKEAEHAAKCARLRTIFRAMGRPFQPNKQNWYAYYDHLLGEKVFYSVLKHNHSSGTYFSSEKACQAAVNAIGEDNFIRYVLGVEYEASKSSPLGTRQSTNRLENTGTTIKF